MMTVKVAKKIVMVGVAGTGMRGLAFLLAEEGKMVIGTDARWKSDGMLEKAKGEKEFARVELCWQVDSVHWNDVDLVIYSDAVQPDSPWRQEAERRDITTMPYQVAVGELAASRRTIAVAGSHGKSSTTSFLAFLLLEAGIDPTVLVGAATPFLAGGHAQLGKSDWLVVEADEYREHFLELHPEILIITSIDFDHADYFPDLNGVVLAFRKLISGMPAKGVVFVPKSVHEKFSLPWPERTIIVSEKEIEDLPHPLPGRHMQMNGALAMGVAKYLEIPHEEARQALTMFPGLQRRFERVGKWEAMTIISDYGHHPTEIAATLQAAHDKWPGMKVGVMLEVHTEERLRIFREDFVKAVQGAAAVWLYPVFNPQGREEGFGSTDQQTLLEELQATGVATQLVPAPKFLKRALGDAATELDVLLVFSAGDLDGALRKTLSK